MVLPYNFNDLINHRNSYQVLYEKFYSLTQLTNSFLNLNCLITFSSSIPELFFLTFNLKSEKTQLSYYKFIFKGHSLISIPWNRVPLVIHTSMLNPRVKVSILLILRLFTHYRKSPYVCVCVYIYKNNSLTSFPEFFLEIRSYRLLILFRLSQCLRLPFLWGTLFSTNPPPLLRKKGLGMEQKEP